MTSNAAYMRKWRQQKPDKYRQTVEQTKAAGRARVRLAHMYPEEYAKLLENEMGRPLKPAGRHLEPIKHGTLGGERSHRYRGEPVCDRCREARNAYQRERYKKARRR